MIGTLLGLRRCRAVGQTDSEIIANEGQTPHIFMLFGSGAAKQIALRSIEQAAQGNCTIIIYEERQVPSSR